MIMRSVPTPWMSGTHGDEACGEVGDLGLAGGVGQDGLAVWRGRCGHEEVFGGADGGEGEDDVGAVEAACGAVAFT